MIIEKEYKRNKHNEIVKRQIVEIQCDKCGEHWSTSYSNRKRKILEIDLCQRCRAKMAWSISAIASVRVPYTCDNCGKEKSKIQTQIKKNNFCSLACRDKYHIKERYSHLEKVFHYNPNEVAYLFGLILGDGHLKKTAKNTTRISIAFDASEKWKELMSIAKDTMDKLGIDWMAEPKIRKSCQMIGFVLPDSLLQKHNLLFSGNKFAAQPCPSEQIIKNINYAVGLLNSDGCYTKSGIRETYAFCNTTTSISDSFSKCLTINGIHHTRFEYNGRLDDRTGQTGKKQTQINICTKTAIGSLHLASTFKMKGHLLKKPVINLE